MAYKLQSRTIHGWSDDITLLGHGLDPAANRWDQQEHALRVLSELHQLWPDASLRVTATDDD